MPKAKKLPSGAWRVRVYSHTEGDKKVYESITGYSKAEVELKAAEYKAHKKRYYQKDITIKDAIERYISSKENVLSPSTLREYRRSQEKNYKEIENMKIKSLTSEELQKFVNAKAATLSPKSVRNIYGLLVASVTLFQPDVCYRITLPQKTVYRPSSPSDEAVRALLENSRGNLHRAILLGIRGMRRGEICALEYEDIVDGIAHIHRDIIKNDRSEWVIKEIPKTTGGDRYIKVPDFGEGTGRVMTCNPDRITRGFNNLKKKLGIELRFHDLRHYFASTAAVLNIPDIYTADMGGWSRSGNSTVMKTVYQNNIKSMSDYYAEKMESHLRKLEEV